MIIPDSSNALLTTNYRIVYDSLGIPSTSARLLEIEVRSASDLLLQTLKSVSVHMNGAPLTDTGWITDSFDLSAYSGQTVKIVFHQLIPENFTGPANIEFDDISLVATSAVPEPSTLAGAFFGVVALGHIARRRLRRVTAN